MTVIVTDTGFKQDDWTAGYVTLGAANDTGALDVAADADPDADAGFTLKPTKCPRHQKSVNSPRFCDKVANKMPTGSV